MHKRHPSLQKFPFGWLHLCFC